LERLTEVDEVLTALFNVFPDDPISQLSPLAKRISENARHLFATLGYIHREGEIVALLNEGVSDDDFPFELRKSQPSGHQYKLQGLGGREIKAICNWPDEVCEMFHQYQWWMKAPSFMEAAHHELADDDMLPFINRTDTISTGGFSKVYLAEIHPSHHNFAGVEPSGADGCHVAIKELIAGSAEEDFRKEIQFFKTLVKKQQHPHPHLITLLATFRWKRKYHIILPRAAENLDNYWDKTDPTFDEPTVRWCLQQISGLVNGLLDIHDVIVRDPTRLVRSKAGSDSSIKVKRGEEKFGRHGDLKPANILWFVGPDDPRGTLKIADFGLGRFHGKLTRSGIDWSKVKFSPTYEPPELRLKIHVSRAYDMWSFGCILLEFASWMLKGAKSSEEFSKARLQPDSNPEFPELSNDEFFTVVDRINRKAVVRDSVVVWVEQLHRHPKCSAFIHDLLDLIMKHLLVILPAERINAIDLNKAFEAFLHKAHHPDYLVRPVPQTAPASKVEEAGGPTMQTCQPPPNGIGRPPPVRSKTTHASLPSRHNSSRAQHQASRLDRFAMDISKFKARVRAEQSDNLAQNTANPQARLELRSRTWPPQRPLETVQV
jgi:serine/threonine protein kinase